MVVTESGDLVPFAVPMAIPLDGTAHSVVISYQVNSNGTGNISHANATGGRKTFIIQNQAPAFGWDHYYKQTYTVESPYTATMTGTNMAGHYESILIVGGCVYHLAVGVWPWFTWSYLVDL